MEELNFSPHVFYPQQPYSKAVSVTEIYLANLLSVQRDVLIIEG
jgi:hypothetical protein